MVPSTARLAASALALIVLACSPADGPTAPDERPADTGATLIQSQVTIYGGNPRYHTYNGTPRVLLGGASNVTPGDRGSVDRAIGNGGSYARVWHNFNIPPAAWRKLSSGKYDLTQWNDAYWSQLRDVVSYAKEKKLILSVMIFSEPGLEARPERWGAHPFNPNNNVNALGLPSTDGVPDFYELSNGKLRGIQEAYVDRLIREVAPYGNVIFELANEYTGPTDWEAHFIGFVQGRTNAPIAVNRLGNPASALTLPGVDQANYHNLQSGSVFRTFLANYTRGRVQHYDEQAIGSNSAADLRSMAWEAVLGGGGINWDQSGNPSETPGISQGLAAFLTSHGFQPWEFVPTTLAGDRPAMRKVTDELVVYVASGSALVNLTDWNGGYSVRWYNPVTRASATQTAITGGGSLTLAPPFTPAVLHVARTSGTPNPDTGRLVSRIVHDVNANGQRDAGEQYVGLPGACSNDHELAGVSVSWTGPVAGTATPSQCDPAPYAASGAIAAGSYDVTATLPDGWQTTGPASAHVTVNPNTDAQVQFTVRQAATVTPQIAIATTGITEGVTLSGPTAVEARVTANLPIQRVDFYLDGFLVTSESQPPYALLSSGATTLPFDFRGHGYGSGPHVLKVLVAVTQTNGGTFTTSRDVHFTLRLDAPVDASFFQNSRRIAQFYFAYLDRYPDAGGFTVWWNARRDGLTDEAISGFFAASTEFGRFGSLADSRFVERIWQNATGRMPSAAQRDHWVAQLGSGRSRGRVVLDMLGQEPALDRATSNGAYVAQLYLGLFGRTPDGPGFNFWVAALDAGVPRSLVEAAFLQSSEYVD